MKLSDNYLIKANAFRAIVLHIIILLFVNDFITQLEEYMHYKYIYRTNTCYLTDLNIISCNLSFPNQNIQVH